MKKVTIIRAKDAWHLDIKNEKIRIITQAGVKTSIRGLVGEKVLNDSKRFCCPVQHGLAYRSCHCSDRRLGVLVRSGLLSGSGSQFWICCWLYR